MPPVNCRKFFGFCLGKILTLNRLVDDLNPLLGANCLRPS